jgi:hypothetical protein
MEETLGERRGGVGGKAIDDLEAPLHPGSSSPQAPAKGVKREAVLLVEVVEDQKLLPERGAPLGVIEAEALELRLGAAPGLHQCPGARFPLGPQGEESPEAVDEGVVPLGAHGDVPWGEELRRDAAEGDLAQAHAFSFLGSERTWKVG